MWPYYLQDPNIPLVYAFEQIGWDIAAKTISIGSLFGLAARYNILFTTYIHCKMCSTNVKVIIVNLAFSLLGAMIPLPRVIYAIAKDGLMFRFLAKINPKFQVS
jgi:amino acid transporter